MTQSLPEKQPTITDVLISLAQMQGKMDAYVAAQQVTASEHARRLEEHDRAIESLREVAVTHITRADLPQKAAVSAWTVTGTVVGAVVGLGSLLTLLVMLMRIIPDVP